MRMLPSWTLFTMIVIGGAMAVIANTLYPLARAQEAKERLATDAKTILLPELKRNMEVSTSIQHILDSGNISVQKFDVTAWETISKGGLLLGLKPDEIAKFLHIYNLIYQANEMNDRILETVTGMQSALQNAVQTRQMFLNSFKSTLSQLRDAFAELEKKS